jgi:type I restriction enzyme S subunit
MSNWPVKKIAEITRLVTDGKHGDCENESDSGYYFLSSKDLRAGRLYYDNPREITYSGFLETHRRTNLEPGDVLLTNCGASIGRVGIAQDDPKIYKTTFQKSVSVIKPDRSVVDGRYLYYFLHCNSDLLIRLGGGAAQPNLLIGDIKRIEVPLPPMFLQFRIASILSAFDDLIENNNRRIAVLEEMSQRVYDEWFVRFRFPGHDVVQMVESELGLIPEGWPVTPILRLCDFEKGTEPGRKAYFDTSNPERVPFLRVGDLSKRSSEIFVERSLTEGRILTRDDVVISLDGTIGVVRRGLEGAFSGGIRRVVRLTNNVGMAYMYRYLISDYAQDVIKAHANGATILHAGSSLNYLLLALPPLDVGARFEAIASPMLDLVLRIERQNANLRTTRDLLLPKLISGELDVSHLPEPEAMAA